MNSAIKQFILSNGGKYINNDSYISAKEVNLFHTDGTHLSTLGNTILLRNWKAALQLLLTNTTSANLYPGAVNQ